MGTTWQSEAPTDKQLEFLKALNFRGESPKTKGSAAQCIQAAIDAIPPTDAQLLYLHQLRYTGTMPKSKSEAHRLIQSLTTRQPEKPMPQPIRGTLARTGTFSVVRDDQQFYLVDGSARKSLGPFKLSDIALMVRCVQQAAANAATGIIL